MAYKYDEDDIKWVTINGNHIPLTESVKKKIKDGTLFKNAKKDNNKETTEVKNKDHTFEMNDVEKKKYKKVGDKIDNLTKEIETNEYKPKHLYDVGYVPESKILKEANKYDLYTTNKTMADGIEIGDNDKEGLKDIGGSTVSYTMSNDRYYNLSKEEKNAISKINQNNIEAEKLEVQNTEIINKKSSRKDWYEHLGEASKHTHETKSGKDYYDELDSKDKAKIIANDKKIEELKQDSIKQAKILDNGPTYGKYPLGQDKNKNISDTKIGDKISKKQKASGIIMLDNDKVLLVEHSDGRFGYPKGHIDKGESEKDAAIREVFEETNYKTKIKDGIRIPIKYSDKNGETREEVYYVGNINSKNKNKIKTGELKGAKFYSYDEAKEKLKDYGNLIRVLDKATGESKEDIKPVKYNTLSDYEEYFRSIGYSKATALKKAKEIITERKRK